jgi:hypothetical protein
MEPKIQKQTATYNQIKQCNIIIKQSQQTIQTIKTKQPNLIKVVK